MSSELIHAIRERITAGQTKEAIKRAVLELGHTEAAFETAYSEAEKIAETKTLEAPSVSDMLTIGLRTMVRRLDVVAIIAVPLVLASLAPLISENFVLPFISFILSLISSAAALFLLTREATEEKDYKTAFRWGLRNFFSLALIGIIGGLMVLGGLVLFIIPGLIVMVSAYFAQFELARHNLHGIKALYASRQLVVGRWWLATRKLLGLTFVLILVTGALVGMLTIVSEQVEQLSLASELLIQILTAFISVAAIVSMYQLYHYLDTTKSAAVMTPLRIKMGYWALFLLGAATLIVIVTTYILYDTVTNWEELMTAQIDNESTLHAVGLKAIERSLQNQGSNAGVCQELVQLFDNKEDVTCNDSADAWALQTSVRGEQWCVDNAMPPKRVETALDDRTECLMLP